MNIQRGKYPSIKITQNLDGHIYEIRGVLPDLVGLKNTLNDELETIGKRLSETRSQPCMLYTPEQDNLLKEMDYCTELLAAVQRSIDFERKEIKRLRGEE